MGIVKIRKGMYKSVAIFLAFSFIVTTFLGNIEGFAAKAAAKKQVKEIQWKNPAIETLSMKRGSKYRLQASVKPKASKVTFRTNNKSIVTVSGKGELKALKVGKATITATASYGNKKSVRLKVTVVPKLIAGKKVSLNRNRMTLSLNGGDKQKSGTIKATVSPKNATVKKVTFVSSNNQVASVNSKGKVTAKKEGSAKITAYAADGRGAKGICKVTVKKNLVQTSLPVTPSAAPSTPPSVTPTPVPTAIPSVTPSSTPTSAPSSTPTSTPSVTGQVVIANENFAAPIYLDQNGKDYAGLSRVAKSFAGDVKLITGKTPSIHTDVSSVKGTAIIAGSIGNNDVIDGLIENGRIDVSNVKGKWEVYQIDVVQNPVAGIDKAIVITGSDKRGTIYGVYHVSELMGVSPWVYWGDVEPVKRSSVALDASELATTSKEPSVKYRGIFLNDEWPSLGSWVNKFGGFNENFYELVYELILRLKGNYLWPAMWSSAFALDGKAEPNASLKLANEYGVVMGTSHHEPMMRAEKEWTRANNASVTTHGNGEWNYATNKDGLKAFWNDAAVRGKGLDSLITLGMRGMEDSPMLPNGTVEDNVNLLKEIIVDQKRILANNGYAGAPTVLTLYKEVEEFWYGKDGVSGLKDWDVLDDVTIMLTEDNFGNLRTLPTEANKDREAGWGMYYHFDYHGGPRSYEWVNTVPLTKVWEQMSMAYDYGVQDVWIVNVGDLKPMEMNISFFLDMAYDFETYGSTNLKSPNEYVEEWAKQQFGNDVDEEGLEHIAYLLKEYAKINGSRKPEIVTNSTYSVENHNEAMTMLSRLNNVIQVAEQMKEELPENVQAAYFQLVYYPAVASANVHRMQIYSGLNQLYYKQKRTSANLYGYLLNQAIDLDKKLTSTYNNNMPQVGDKWKGMMSTEHVGYTTWDGGGWSYPEARALEADPTAGMIIGVQGSNLVYRSGSAALPEFTSTNRETYYVDIANAGGEAFAYTATADQEWITLTKETGTVVSQDTIGVSVDYGKVDSNRTGTVTIEGGGTSVKLLVSAKVTDVDHLEPMTFVEEHGYISMEAKRFSDKKSAGDGSSWEEIEDYGRTESSLKVFPNRGTYQNVEDAPYLEYKVYVKKNGEYALQTYVAPSNNVDWNRVSMKYGVKIDDGGIMVVDTLNPVNYTAGKSGTKWQDYVMENIRITQSLHTLSSGEHTIRIYSVDPALVLQKLVLYRTAEGIKTSYFGPSESYYVGKEVNSQSDWDIQEQLHILPAVVAGDAMPADVLVPFANDYKVKVNATSSQTSAVHVLWNGATIGTIQVTGEGEYDLANEIALPYGKGTLSYRVESGDARVNAIRITLKNPTVKYRVPTSSNENEFYLDLNECKTAGTPSISANVPETEVGENEVTFRFTEWKQRVNFELAAEQIAKIKSAQSIQVEITGTSSTQARFRYGLGDPSVQQNWNGTNVFGIEPLSNILKQTLSFSGNINANAKVYDYLILQLGNPNLSPDAVTTADVTIQSIKITCVMPEVAYQVPEAENDNEFYLNLNDCKTAGHSSINANVPEAVLKQNEVVYKFTEWGQRVNVKLTTEQVERIKAAGSVTVTITGKSSTDAKFRYNFGNPSSGQNWNGTNNVNLDVFSAILEKTLTFSGNKSDATLGYFILQLGNTNNSSAGETINADVTIQSIKVTLNN